MKVKYNDLRKSLLQLTKEELVSLFADVYTNVSADTDYVSVPDCPRCSSANVIRFGMKNGKQRFMCKTCNRTFLPTTNTVMFMSHFDKDIWKEMLTDTLDGQSLSYSEKRLGISHQVAFNMRHKLLLAFQDVRKNDPVILSDVSELDETFVLECYKGKKLPNTVIRKSRKHGAKAVKRGISNEYICICTGIQRKGNVIIESVNRAKPTSDEITQIFKGHIEDGTLVITDGLRSYNVLSELADCSIKNANSEKGSFYHLNSINNVHSFIKHRYEFYRGVATKYLNRYNSLFQLAYRCTDDLLSTLSSRLFCTSRSLMHHSIKDVKEMNLLCI